MPAESIRKTVTVALGVCIVCSVLVSTAAVSLRGMQEENRSLDRIRNILLAVDIGLEGKDIRAVYEKIVEPIMIDLASGMDVPAEEQGEIISIESFDLRVTANDPSFSRAIPDDRDTAGIRRVPEYMVVYLVKEQGSVEKVVLPVYGKGLWSTMYGFIALGRDLTTIEGFTVYEHGETPGLGGEVDNPRWKKLWKGKPAFDERGDLRIEVVKGVVNTSKEEAMYQIDGLSGATWTSLGVNSLVRFWLGDDGYGPFLKKLREELHGQV